MRRLAVIALLIGCSEPEETGLCPVGAEGAVGFQRFEDVVMRWQSIRCIPVFVDPSLAAFDARAAASISA